MVLFKVNDRVMAKWPGSSLWFEGIVVDLNDREYQVQFKDEAKSEFVVKHRDVKLFTTFQRSRSRSRGRSKSRGRTSKSKPVEVEEVVEPKKEEVKIVNAQLEASVSIVNAQREASVPIVNAQREASVPIVNAQREASVPLMEPKEDSPKPVPILPTLDDFSPRTSTPTTRQSLRIAAWTEKNAVDVQVNNVNDNTPSVEISEEAPPASIGGRLCGGLSCTGSHIKSAVLMFIPSLATLKIAPVVVILLALPLVLTRMCTKNKCTVMKVPDIPAKLNQYYDLKAVAIVAGFLLVQLILGLIPLGRKVNLPNGAVLRCNGYISVLVSVALIPALLYFEYDVLVVYTLYQHILATLTVFSILVTLLLYIRARNIPNDAKNPTGNTGSFLPDLFKGRETSPVILGIDLKYFLFRAMCVMILLLNVIVVIKDLNANSGVYSPTLIVACTLQIFSAVDLIWFEESQFTTYEYTRMGCGLFLVNGTLLMPFYMGIFTRTVLNHRTELEWYFLSLIAAVNLLGYTLFRGSYSQMHAFRKNPSDPALAHLESLPTSAGTRLLVSGWWSVVRHPNYLGNLAGMLSWTLMCGINLGLPWILLALCTAAMVQRILEVENDCKRKYGTAWDSYTERVKYRLIPKVF